MNKNPGKRRAVDQYYRCLDEHCYDTLRKLLSEKFTQRRPDRSFGNPDEFIGFMRGDRPVMDTRHRIESVEIHDDQITASGRLEGPGGKILFRFEDRFEFDDQGKILQLTTSLL